MKENVLKVKDVADICQVCPKTIYREIKRGLLPATLVGKEYRILESDLREYLGTNYLNNNKVTMQGTREKKIKISLSIDAETKRALDELNANKYFGLPLSVMVNKLLHSAVQSEKIRNLHKDLGIGAIRG